MSIDKITELSYKTSSNNNNKKNIRDCYDNLKNMQWLNGVLEKVKTDQDLWVNQWFHLYRCLYLLVFICLEYLL